MFLRKFIQYGLLHTFRVRQISQDTKLAIVQGIAATVEFASNGGNAAGHGFQIDDAEAFTTAGYDIGIRKAAVVGLLMGDNGE